jgi:hypothetical protein
LHNTTILNLEVYLNRPIPMTNKISRYNDNYFCTVTKIVFSPNRLTVHIDERGDFSLGDIQDPHFSTLFTNRIRYEIWLI